MTNRWILPFGLLSAAVAGGAAFGWRWPTLIAAVLALGVVALLPVGSVTARAALVVVAAAIVVEVSGWRDLTAETDLLALITDTGLRRQQTIRESTVAALLVVACVLFAAALARSAAAGMPQAVVAPLVIGGVLLGTRTWLAVDSVAGIVAEPPPLPAPEETITVSSEAYSSSLAVSVAEGPDLLYALIMLASLGGAALLGYACARLNRREPAA
ncbi:hypothetical protein OHA21_14260 [Actinoplanes sp. NBC_00393]|uniref:hypothetical protein n=1 Tax=Actinoplanes sp. NBC_00393 TaxID=2975953 RepID=UPI002E22B2B7